jgi:PAS domain S-box-containing protein
MMLTEPSPVLLVLVLSIALQTAAAIMAIRLIAVTGRRVAWGLIAAALTLMAVRRIVPLYRLLSGDTSIEPDFFNESIGLVLSACMAGGIAGIRPIFAERMRAEQALQESEERLRLTLEAAQIGTWDWDVAHDRWYASSTYYTMLGYPPQKDPTDRSEWFDRLHPDDRAAVSEKIRDVLSRSFNEYTYEARMRHADGSYRWQHVRGFGIERGADGQVTRMLGIRMDINERKLAEKELSEFAEIVESSDDAIVGKTMEGIVTSWNQGAERIFGYRANEIVGKPISILVPQDRIAEEWMILDEIRQGHSVSHYETMRRRKDGRMIDVSVTVSPIKDSTGRVFGASKIARDISEQKRTEAELQKYRERLEELVAERTAALESANKELESFSYSVSHDLRTPLRAINGYASMLATKLADSIDDEGRRMLQLIRDNTARMGHLIDDLLAFSRSGRLEMHLTQVDMRALVDSVWSDLEPAREGRDIQFEQAPLPPARGDPAMLRQVWVNLLTNAIKFTSKKASAHIAVGGSTQGDKCVYHVIDDGAGFDQAYAHKLFGVFQRLHGMDEFEGTGIGLAIVNRIVGRHGGSVSAEGRVNEGASFQFTLPLALS